MFLTVNGKEIIFSTFFWLSSSLKYPHCRYINLQWGIFNAIVKQNTLTSEYITYPITHNRCALPYGVLNGYNTNSGSTCLTLEASTLEHFKWVIGTTSSVEIVNYNRWFSIGM